jgi:hypothetical protein
MQTMIRVMELLQESIIGNLVKSIGFIGCAPLIHQHQAGCEMSTIPAQYTIVMHNVEEGELFQL